MSTAGRFLELMISHLQRTLLPEGVKVTSPERFYHNGKQVGEIDITLRGDFASSRIFIGIECRDRPQDGPQGIPWLREIRGKQEQLKVDKMIAVSSTGFVPEAIELAKEWRIDLLTVEDTTHIRTDGWFHPEVFHLSLTHHNLCAHQSQLTMEGEGEDIDFFESNFGMPFILQGDDRPLMSIGEYVQPKLKLLLSKLPSGTSFKITAKLEYVGPILGRINGRLVTVKHLIMPVEIDQETVTGKILMNTVSTPDDKRFLHRVGVGRGIFRGEVFQSFVTQKVPISPRGRRHTILNYAFLKENGDPFFPPGTELRFSVGDPDFHIGPRQPS